MTELRPAVLAGADQQCAKFFKRTQSESTRKESKLRAAWLALLCLQILSGCSAMKVKMGWRVDLAQTPVASIEASLPKGPAIAPGQKSPLVAKITEPDGTVLFTEGQGRGKVQWKDLQVTADVVKANNKGVLTLPKDPRISDGKTGHVTITAASHPDVKAELDVAFRYDISFSANFSGGSGFNGLDGQNGIDGSSGSSGSLDPNNPSPGGNGSDGTNGSDGDAGKPGGDAPAVQVQLTMHPGNQALIEASVSAAGKQKFYLIDPHGGWLTVKADGGEGGRGGTGGRGGRGGSGGIGTPNGNSGRDGLNGHDGLRGSDGKGGSITVTYDPAVKSYLGAMHLSHQNGPAPVFTEATVGALW
jgi:hypothetical protein